MWFSLVMIMIQGKEDQKGPMALPYLVFSLQTRTKLRKFPKDIFIVLSMVTL